MINITQSTQLPPGCVFEQVTLNIQAANLNFNCNGAVFNGLRQIRRNAYGQNYRPESAPQGVAFRIHKNQKDPKPLRNITLQNCQILNYVHGVDIRVNLPDDTRNGLRQGKINEDQLRAQAPANIRIQNTRILNSHGSGIFVYPYVTGLQFLNSSIKGAGGPGLYLDAGSRQARIENSVFEGNGYASYDGRKRERSARRSAASRREGLAIDASSGNLVRNNTFRNNGDGGVYLYKNCWEGANRDPRSLPRPEGANYNRIEGNRFIRETTGIWLAERADRDLSGFDCGDPLLRQEGGDRYYRDYARGNRVLNNRFEQVGTGIRVMDDGNVIQNNVFSQSTGADIDIGSRIRALTGDPVHGNSLQNNRPSRPDGIRYLYGAR
ncbi:MAG: right-handed parallel beta-helix repeat-containing protein [Thiolinea sp.]